MVKPVDKRAVSISICRLTTDDKSKTDSVKNTSQHSSKLSKIVDLVLSKENKHLSTSPSKSRHLSRPHKHFNDVESRELSKEELEKLSYLTTGVALQKISSSHVPLVTTPVRSVSVRVKEDVQLTINRHWCRRENKIKRKKNWIYERRWPGGLPPLFPIIPSPIVVPRESRTADFLSKTERLAHTPAYEIDKCYL